MVLHIMRMCFRFAVLMYGFLNISKQDAFGKLLYITNEDQTTFGRNQSIAYNTQTLESYRSHPDFGFITFLGALMYNCDHCLCLCRPNHWGSYIHWSLQEVLADYNNGRYVHIFKYFWQDNVERMYKLVCKLYLIMYKT